jgi:hypothetical protein
LAGVGSAWGAWEGSGRPGVLEGVRLACESIVWSLGRVGWGWYGDCSLVGVAQLARLARSARLARLARSGGQCDPNLRLTGRVRRPLVLLRRLWL